MILLVATLILLVPASAAADYPDRVERLEQQRSELAEEAEAGEVDVDALRTELERRVLGLAEAWLGTRWGLGAPQTQEPGDGKINCGMFVATMLEDAGIVVDRVKLQRQPAELIIKTFSRAGDIERFRNASMEEFVRGARAMGDGLYIIGLDFHVGFLHVDAEEIRFIHASYVTHTVVDEEASAAEPIVTSKYRVVGKLFDERMVRKWLAKRPFPVKGNW